MKTDQKLLHLGLEVLADHGQEALTIDRLCQDAGVTKGSFYHHFKNRDGYVRSLLEFWTEQNTLRLIEFTNQAGTPEERYLRIVCLSDDLPKGPENAVRSWAQFDSVARKYQTKVDELRINFLRELIYELTGDQVKSNVLADLIYALHVGCESLFPQGERRAEITRFTREMLSIVPQKNDNGDET